MPTVPDFDQLKTQVEHLDRLIDEAVRLRAQVEQQMNTLRRSGDQDRAGQPTSRRKRPPTKAR